jgi:hypothetical protein
LAVVVAGVWGPVGVVDVCFAVGAKVRVCQSFQVEEKEEREEEEQVLKTYFQSAR